VQFLKEKKMQLQEVEEMSLARNGDMVRPQVKAVMDLLLAGIEIDTDFRKGFVYYVRWRSLLLTLYDCVGYDSLLESTDSKSEEVGLFSLISFISPYALFSVEIVHGATTCIRGALL